MPLHECLQASVRAGMLNPSARHGIINLIPKRNRYIIYVKHLRPITLLNYDFKIYAKMISNRLETAAELIGKQQNGFIKGRSLVNNIAKTSEILAQMTRDQKQGVVALIDFEKCFDRIEHQSIKAVFEYFNFGANFIDMIMLLFKNIQVCTQNNGFTSKLLNKGRGINQGCPASPLIYSYCGEIMNHLMMEDPNVTGVPIDVLENVLSQFTDDTVCIPKI